MVFILYTDNLKRDYETMVYDAVDRLRDKTELSNFSAGSIARSLLEVYYDDMEELHNRLAFSTAMSFLSSAEGPYLDEIAKLFDMQRYENETDENFKYRIQHATEKLATANKVAIRLSILSIDGVYDVEFRNHTRGPGSFDAYIITDQPETPEEIVRKAQAAIEEVEAYGNDGRVVQPQLINIDLNLYLVFYDNISVSKKKNVKSSVSNQLRTYISNIDMGEDLIINQLIDLIMDVDQESIKDVKITQIFIDSKETIINNKSFYWDQRLVPGNIIVK